MMEENEYWRNVERYENEYWGSVQRPQSAYWESVARPGKAPHDDQIRGSFHLHFHYGECEFAWEMIVDLTRRKKLGYMCSLSPDHMEGGPWIGQRTISVHTLHKKRRKVRDALEQANLYGHTFKYNLIQKFRRHADDDGSWVVSENEESEESGDDYDEVVYLQ